MIQIKEVDDELLWENFVSDWPHTPFTQSWLWGEFQQKLGKQFWRLGLLRENKLVATALVVADKSKLGPSLYCQDGPLGQLDRDILKLLKNYLLDLSKAEGSIYIKLDPRIEAADEIETMFRQEGFRQSPGLFEVRHGWVLDITKEENVLLSEMRKTTRYEIKQREKDQVEVSFSKNLSDFDTFYNLLAETARRKKFTPPAKNYLKTQFETFLKKDSGLLVFAKIQGQIRATAFLILYGDTATYLHGASLENKGESTSAAYSLQWEAIKEAKRRGKKLYDFWGVVPDNSPNHPWYGISLFKKGFGGHLINYLPSQDYPTSPKFYLVRGLENWRKFKSGV